MTEKSRNKWYLQSKTVIRLMAACTQQSYGIYRRDADSISSYTLGPSRSSLVVLQASLVTPRQVLMLIAQGIYPARTTIFPC